MTLEGKCPHPALSKAGARVKIGCKTLIGGKLTEEKGDKAGFVRSLLLEEGGLLVCRWLWYLLQIPFSKTMCVLVTSQKLFSSCQRRHLLFVESAPSNHFMVD